MGGLLSDESNFVKETQKMKNPNNDSGEFTLSNSKIQDEILVEILIRLPAKSIHRFKCVSKKWLSLFCSPHFLSTYLTLSPPPSSWLLLDRAGRHTPSPSPNSGPKLSFSPDQPPNITKLTLSGLPTNLTKHGSPHIVTSSNGLILFALTPSNHLHICNPVTLDWAPLPVPTCGKIRDLTRIALSVKYTPNYDDVSFVVIELRTLPLFLDPTQTPTFLKYTSDSGQWEAKPAKIRAGSKAFRRCCSLASFEVNGKLFWMDHRGGLVVLEDPFGEREELVYISLPDYPVGSLGSIFPVSGLVVCAVMKGKETKMYKLEDVEKGDWSLLYKTDNSDGSFKLPAAAAGPNGQFMLTAIDPFDVDVVFMTTQEKLVVLNKRKSVVLDILPYAKSKEEDIFGFLWAVVLPSWPTPLPLRLRATSAKEKGNFDFKNKNFKEALLYYSRSIQCFPTAAAYSNRAAAHLQLDKYQEAETDCSEALKLDDQYMKVYVRRAKARKELGKLLEAKGDVEIALKLDGGQQELLKLSSEINCLLEKESEM